MKFDCESLNILFLYSVFSGEEPHPENEPPIAAVGRLGSIGSGSKCQVIGASVRTTKTVVMVAAVGVTAVCVTEVVISLSVCR